MVLPAGAHAYDLVAVGRYAYVAEGQAGLAIYDILSSPSTLVGTCDTPGVARDVSVRGSYAYVADGDQGIQVIDVSDPAAPTIVANLPTAGSANHVSFSLGQRLEDFESLSGWVQDSGTLGEDTVHVKHGTGSLMLRADAGALAKAHHDNLNWDLSSLKDGLQLWVYLDSPEASSTVCPPASWASGFRTTMATSATSSSSRTTTSTRAGTCSASLHPIWQAHGSPSWDQPIQRMTVKVTGGAAYGVTMSVDDLRGGVAGLGSAFLWTFDDGYENVYSMAYPYLNNLGMKGTEYIVGDWVGNTGQDHHLPARHPLRCRLGDRQPLNRSHRP